MKNELFSILVVGASLAGGCSSSPGLQPEPDAASCTGAPVAWQTPTAALSAREFSIVANGLCFTSSGATVDVHSDPGTSTYTTLELIWTEHAREMRFFLYLSADASGWWSSEIRTYNAQPSADWIHYEGPFFHSPQGSPYSGDVDLVDPSIPPRGELHLHGLQLSTTLSGS
jgi:hypothetical protein